MELGLLRKMDGDRGGGDRKEALKVKAQKPRGVIEKKYKKKIKATFLFNPRVTLKTMTRLS